MRDEIWQYLHDVVRDDELPVSAQEIDQVADQVTEYMANFVEQWTRRGELP